jgi:hypothetical protein
MGYDLQVYSSYECYQAIFKYLSSMYKAVRAYKDDKRHEQWTLTVSKLKILDIKTSLFGQ